MADVFVSYARADEPLARRIAERLTAAGFSVWWDSELLPHNRFAQIIEKEIHIAKAVVVIWSEAAIESQWVRAEADLGRLGRKLIQVTIDKSMIPLPFNQFQTADLRRWRGSAIDPQWEKILASVRHFTSDRSDTSPITNAPNSGPLDEARKPPWVGARLRRTHAFGLAMIAFFALAAGGGTYLWKSWHEPVRGERIAIQPFETIGGTAHLEDVARELSNSLQNVLTQDQLQTLSAPEEEGLKGTDFDSRLKSLGIGLLFSGTVQAKDPDIAVSMRLDDPLQHATLWTAEMSQAAAQSDQLQARVGALTIAVLNCSAQALAPTVRMTDAALQAFLHACELSETSDHGLAGAGAADVMLEAMRQASNAAPEFAAGHSMLAKHLAFVATAIAPDQSLRAEAEREARRSLELDPKDPDAFVTFGLLAPELDFAQREKFFRLALASNPAWPHANGFLGNVMTDVGRLQDAETLYQRAAAVNPQSIDWTMEAVDGLVNAGQGAEADRELARIAQLWPNDIVVWYSQMESLTAQKRWGDALKLLDTAGNFGAAISPSWVVSQRALMTALQSGDPVQRNALRQGLMTSSNTDPQTAIVRLAMLGFSDDAFAVAANYHPGNSDSPSFLFQPETASLRNDPRFMVLAARFRLIDYWRRTARWPDFCRDPGLPYNCVSQAQETIGRLSHQ